MNFIKLIPFLLYFFSALLPFHDCVEISESVSTSAIVNDKVKKPAEHLPIVAWAGLFHDYKNLEKYVRFELKAINYTGELIIIHFSENALQNKLLTLLLHPDKQVNRACEIIKADERLKNGYYGVGWSQGGLFLRAVLQRCDDDVPRMKRLLTIATPHMGVFRDSWYRYIVYNSKIQQHIVPATYFRNLKNKEAYLTGSTFLADINNEKVTPNNEKYRSRISGLDCLSAIRNTNDRYVTPAASAWFALNDSLIDEERFNISYDERFHGDIYKKLGLDLLDEQDKFMINTVKSPGHANVGDVLRKHVNWLLECH